MSKTRIVIIGTAAALFAGAFAVAAYSPGVTQVQGPADGNGIPVPVVFDTAPTVNLGTLNGAAEDATLQALLALLPSSLVGGGLNTRALTTSDEVTAAIADGSSLTCNAGTNLNTSALATAANQTNGTQEVMVYDGSNVIGTSAHPVRVDPTGSTTQPVSLASTPLPTNAATASAQTTAQSSLNSIVSSVANIPAQGQALAAGSTPVVLTAAQIATLTPLGPGCLGATIANTKVLSGSASNNANTRIVAGTAGTRIYFCSIHLSALSAANTFALVGGATGTTCGTSTYAVGAGAATSTTGESFVTSGGEIEGNGIGLIAETANANDDVCLFVGNGGGPIQWKVTYVQQ